MRAVALGIGAGLVAGAVGGAAFERVTRVKDDEGVALYRAWKAGRDAGEDAWAEVPPRPKRGAYGAVLLFGGLGGGLVSVVPLGMMLDKKGSDVFRVVGAKGAAAVAAPVFVGAFLAGALISDARN